MAAPPGGPDDELDKEAQEKIDAVKEAQQRFNGVEIIGRIKVAVLLHELKESGSRYGDNFMGRVAKELELRIDAVYRDALVASMWTEPQLTCILEAAKHHKRGIRWSHLQVIAKVPDGDQRAELVRECVEHGIAVRLLKSRVRAMEAPADAASGKTVTAARELQSADVKSAEDGSPKDVGPLDEGLLTNLEMMVAQVKDAALSLREGTAVLDRETASKLLARAGVLEPLFEQVWLELMEGLRTAAAASAPKEADGGHDLNASGENKSTEDDDDDGDDDDEEDGDDDDDDEEDDDDDREAES